MDISKIEIKDVNFSYKEVKVYKKNLNMCLEKGSIYLIKGKNGSGKSTLAGILLKIWNFSREALAETIGICFQKPPIFRDTIRNNIALNDPISVEKYISLLSFYKDLEEMGRTLEEELIDTGSVSGGQAQKIGIIRTVCRERSVYIFDEPTSNLDSVSKKEFYDMIEHLKQNSIIILFSHEADAEKSADFIIEL